jgi:hypothetical protein
MLYCTKRGVVTRGIDNMRKARGEITTNLGSLRMKGVVEISGNAAPVPTATLKIK